MILHHHHHMSDLPQTRQSLLLELGKHSGDAWAEFLRVYEGAVFRLCRSKGLQEADAMDVTQEVLEAVYHRAPTWEGDASRGSFRAWLLQVARNISADCINSRARVATGSGDSQVERMLHGVPNTMDEHATEFDIEYRRSLFEWAASEVKSEVRDVTWQAFQLTAVQGLTSEEVASRLQIPIGSVYTAKCRVVSRIRTKVGILEDSNPG